MTRPSTARLVLGAVVAVTLVGATAPASAGLVDDNRHERQVCLLTSDDPNGRTSDGLCLTW